MTKEEIKEYVANCNDKERAIEEIRLMVEEKTPITKEALDGRLSVNEYMELSGKSGGRPQKSQYYLPMIIAVVLSFITTWVGYAMSEWAKYENTLIMIKANPLCYIGALALSAVSLIASWVLFTKAEQKGWKALIPFYSTWVMYEIIYGKGSKIFLLLIPLFNIYWLIKTAIDFGHVYGKKGGFCVGLVFVPWLFMVMMAFDESAYRGILSEQGR